MEKLVHKMKMGDEDPNIEYWRSLSGYERLVNLEKIRKEVIKSQYGTDPGFQRVVNIIRRKKG